MRRDGLVPGVLYGGDGEPISFAVGARELRPALAARGAVLELSSTPAARAGRAEGRPAPPGARRARARRPRARPPRPSRSRPTCRSCSRAATTRPRARRRRARAHHPQRDVEALPTSIPESITHDVSGMAIGDTLLLSELTRPDGVTFVGELDEIVLATLSPPRLRVEGDEEIEQETGLVGEGSAAEDDARPPRTRPTGPPPTATSARLLRSDRAVPRSTGSSSGSATPAANTSAPATTSASWSSTSSRGDGTWSAPRERYRGRLREGRAGAGGPRVALLEPQTFMNEAGRSAGPARGAYRLDLDRVLVVHDEIDLPFGRSAPASAAGWPATTASLAAARARQPRLLARARRRRTA